MKDINLKDIIDLASENIEEPTQELKKTYDWYHERKLTKIRTSIGFGITLFAALIIAYIKDDIKVNIFFFVASLISAILTASFGIYELVQIRKTGKSYIAALTLLNRFRKIKPFLGLYKNSKHDD